jgi:hypothetical protein
MKKFICFLSVLCLCFAACRNVTDLVHDEDQLVAISQIDTAFSFENVSTFSVNDTIYEIYIDETGTETKGKIRATYQTDLIIKQMEERGFTYIPLRELLNDSLPDLFFDLVYVENKYAQVSGFGWWHDYYDPYWFHYWDWGEYAPYYPVSYTATPSYTIKSFIMDCVYLEKTPIRKYNAQSCFFGLVRGINDKHTENEIAKYINQCFDQTPDLIKINKNNQ